MHLTEYHWLGQANGEKDNMTAVFRCITARVLLCESITIFPRLAPSNSMGVGEHSTSFPGERRSGFMASLADPATARAAELGSKSDRLPTPSGDKKSPPTSKPAAPSKTPGHGTGRAGLANRRSAALKMGHVRRSAHTETIAAVYKRGGTLTLRQRPTHRSLVRLNPYSVTG